VTELALAHGDVPQNNPPRRRPRITLGCARGSPAGALGVARAQPAASELDEGPCTPVTEDRGVGVRPRRVVPPFPLVREVAAQAGAERGGAGRRLRPIQCRSGLLRTA